MPAMKSETAIASAPIELDRILETVHAQQAQLHGTLASLESRSRAASVRLARWSFGVVSGCALVPALLSWMLMPSRTQLLQARLTLDQLSAAVAQLSREGGRIELRRCGAANRLCVRIDRKSPLYGESADFMVLKGY
jgi:hypothetical protein